MPNPSTAKNKIAQDDRGCQGQPQGWPQPQYQGQPQGWLQGQDREGDLALVCGEGLRDRRDPGGNDSQTGQGQVAPPILCPGKRSDAPGVVGPSPSLDTCDQVRKNGVITLEDLVFERDEDRRAWLKRVLSDALLACGRASEAEAVSRCGLDFKVGKCLDCGAAPAFPITCDHRLCPDCSARRGAILVAEHRDVLSRIRYPKMLTLTFLSVDRLDKAYIKLARNCFTRLRRRKVMAGCWGGIYSFEATYSDIHGWHLHIHALIGSTWIDQAELSREWREISGAEIVDIRAVKGDDKWKAIKEVVKYPAKAVTFLGSPELVNEFLAATNGVNLAYGFGALYRVKTKRSGDGGMRCPLCGGRDITWDGGYGFCVPRSLVKRVKGGYLWRPPPF
ncbi:hypothetical protein ES703_104391 [subsurface metagenome]